jgi:hypothetical protein
MIKVVFQSDGKYGCAYGHIHYKDGNKIKGSISGAGTYSWRVVKVLEEDLGILSLPEKKVDDGEVL